MKYHRSIVNFSLLHTQPLLAGHLRLDHGVRKACTRPMQACFVFFTLSELAVCPGISNTSIGIFFRGPSGPTLLAASNITGQNITYSTLLLTSNVHPWNTPCALNLNICSCDHFEIAYPGSLSKIFQVWESKSISLLSCRRKALS